MLPPLHSVEFIDAIKREDPDAMVALYGLLWRLQTSLLNIVDPSQFDDVVQESFVAVVENLKNGSLRDPAYIYGYSKTILRRASLKIFNRGINDRRNVPLDSHAEPHSSLPAALAEQIDVQASPEGYVADRQLIRIVAEVFHHLSKKDQELIYRFYWLEQDAEYVRTAMGMDEQQFRREKNRAKGRLRLLVDRYMRNGLAPRQKEQPAPELQEDQTESAPRPRTRRYRSAISLDELREKLCEFDRQQKAKPKLA
jgi:DNA-directed RNA polymerase specialized sigma24 family protein